MTDQRLPAGVKTQTVHIGPAEAEMWLNQANTKNRRLNNAVVGKYARDMTAGRWHFTGDPIQFAQDGTLLNGQHRLSAIVLSGVTIPMTCVYGLPMEAQGVMDAGKTRQASHQLAIDGVPNSTAVAGLARLMIRWNNGAVVTKGNYPSTAEVLDFCATHQDALVNAVRISINVRGTMRISNNATAGLAFRSYEAAEVFPQYLSRLEVDEFFDLLQTGAGLQQGNPILTFRNTIPNRSRDMLHDLYYLVRTWNAWRSGETMSKLQLPAAEGITTSHLELKIQRGRGGA